ncbi:WW domain-binding protein 4, partial [Dorcoceras hygrometricum]
QYWVSQGNKWCDICKIWISNNPASIRNHELGQRHKANVTQKLNMMREEKAAKDKEEKAAVRIMEQIESKANRSYQKDLASFQEARDSNANALLVDDNDKGTGGGSTIAEEWEYESSSGYYYNHRTSCYYDPNSGFYYTDSLGKWVTQEEALAASKESSVSIGKKSITGKLATANKPANESKSASTSQSARPPGRVVSTPLNPMRSVKGAPSSITVSKRKRADEKPHAVSEEEANAIKAREAARKRVEKREKPLLGLYTR